MQVIVVKAHRFGEEVWYFGPRAKLDAEDHAERLVINHPDEHVEVQHLQVGLNPLLHLGALPKYESRISRLDIYFINERRQLARKTPNIF